MRRLIPITWAKIDGVEIIDPDGWRADGQSFDVPIARDEWERRRDESTIHPVNVKATPNSSVDNASAQS